jgi:hypothetical protein
MHNENLNPYASPGETSSHRIQTPQAILSLRAPALGLLLLAALWGGSMAIGFGIRAADLAANAWHGEMRQSHIRWENEQWPKNLAALLFLGSSGFIGYGAVCMRYGVKFRVAQIAAMIACVPFLSPAIWLGIPFGIWALIVLQRKDVRRAFGYLPTY